MVVCLCASVRLFTMFISHSRVKSLDTYQSKWLLLWAEAFCLRQPGLQGKQTHTDESCNGLLFMHGLSKGTSVFSSSHFPFVYPHTLSPTPHELFFELKINFHFWPFFSVPVVHLHLFGVSFSLSCSSALWQKICLLFFFFHLHSEMQQTLTCFSVYACLSSSLFQWYPVPWVTTSSGNATKFNFMQMRSNVMQWLPMELQTAIRLIRLQLSRNTY